MYKFQKKYLFFCLFGILFSLSNCNQKSNVLNNNSVQKTAINCKAEIKKTIKDSIKPINSLVLMFDTDFNNKHIQLLIDSNGRHDFLILRVNGCFIDTGIIYLEPNTYYPCWNIYTFQDNYGNDSLNLRRTLIFKHYLYITFEGMSIMRQLFIIDINKMRFIRPDNWTTSIWTYLLGFIVDGDKIITCDRHPDPTYRYSRMPFTIYRVMGEKIKTWKKFKYNVPSAAMDADDSMRTFMHKLLYYYKVKYR